MLIGALRGASEEVRLQAAQKLMSMGGRAVSALPALERALGDAACNVRYWAAIAIGRISPPQAAPAIPLLSEALDASALPGLLKALGDANADVRSKGAAAIAAITA